MALTNFTLVQIVEAFRSRLRQERCLEQGPPLRGEPPGSPRRGGSARGAEGIPSFVRLLVVRSRSNFHRRANKRRGEKKGKGRKKEKLQVWPTLPAVGGTLLIKFWSSIRRCAAHVFLSNSNDFQKNTLKKISRGAAPPEPPEGNPLRRALRARFSSPQRWTLCRT